MGAASFSATPGGGSLKGMILDRLMPSQTPPVFIDLVSSTLLYSYCLRYD